MAEVYDALDLRLDRPVALKLLRRGLVTAPGMVARAEAEARLAAKVHHPNVVAILDAGSVDGMPFVVMERLAGTTLADRLRDAPLPEDEIRAIGEQVLRGLTAAHELGVAHRDVKPSNVLAGPGGVWKVADFGIATWLASDTTLSATGEIVGSAPYLAPERLDGRPATPASDVFSAGVLLYEAAAGRRPVERDDALATVMAWRDGAADPLAEHRPDLDPALRDAIERAIAVDPDERWPTAAAFAEALRAGGSGTAAPTAPAPTIATDPIATVPLAPATATDVLPAAPPTVVTSATDAPTEQLSTTPPAVDRPVPTQPVVAEPSAAGQRAAAVPASEVAATASGPTARDRRWRRVRAFRADPSRALRTLVMAAVALLLAVVVVTIVLASGADAPGGDAVTIDPAVPDDLRRSLEGLREAIGR